MGKPKGVRIVVWKWSVSAAAVVPSAYWSGRGLCLQCRLLHHAGLCSVLLAANFSNICPSCQNGLVREARVMFQGRFWNLVQYPKRVICLSSDHVECTSGRSSKRLVAAIVQILSNVREQKSRLARTRRSACIPIG